MSTVNPGRIDAMPQSLFAGREAYVIEQFISLQGLGA